MGFNSLAGKTSLKGYPRLAAFLSQRDGENLLLFRRFSYLQLRLILQRQDELRGLEEALDKSDGESLPGFLACREVHDEASPGRKDLFSEIQKQLDELLWGYANPS